MKSKKRHIALIAAAVMLLTVVPALAAEPAAAAGKEIKPVSYTHLDVYKRQVYLYIEKDKAEIRDASKMWGMLTGEAEEAIVEELGHRKFESSIIGPAGENQIPYAAIMHRRSRANGRNGVGAVMGSKNLKALVVKKAPPVLPEDPDNMKKYLTLNVKEKMAANDTIVDTAVNGSAGCVDAVSYTHLDVYKRQPQILP